MSLKARLAIRVAIVLPLVAALMFVPAGSLEFWQGWVFLGVFAVFNAILLAHFYRRDPKLLERRLQNREKAREQKLFQVIWMPLWIAVLVLPGLDYRWGWSRTSLGGVPVWLSWLAQALLLCSWLLMFQVFRFNTFASTVVQVEAGQKVVTDGPYRIVRHPMYSGIVLLVLATPLALGSYFTLPVAALLVPVLIYRLLNEERVLRRKLPGYAEYCSHTRYRLIPRIF